MKKVLITGSNSFIGMSFEQYIAENFSDKYIIDTIDMKDPSWRDKDFSAYDIVFHVAGIAHSDNGKITDEIKDRYYSVNCDLAVDTAKKAKAENVRQFIFMSSAIVYGDSSPIGKTKHITSDTKTSPANCYGDSKVQAEIGLNALKSNSFNVVILRPPMVYGKGCKGNYLTLEKIAAKLPVFPKVDNSRSMIYIENLCEFIRLMIENNESGIFHPQNESYSNTSELVKMIAEANDKKIKLIKGFTWLLRILSHVTGIVNKAFGNLTYDMKISEYKEPYRVVKDLKDTIYFTECKN